MMLPVVQRKLIELIKTAAPATHSLLAPFLRASTQPHALGQLQPALWLAGSAVALAKTDLTQLAQHLVAAPELTVLDSPLYGLPALHLAQDRFQISELTVRALREVAASATACGPRLYALLCRQVHPGPFAKHVVQAWCWSSASAPLLPPGIPGGRPMPGSAEVKHLLDCIRPPGVFAPVKLRGTARDPRDLRSLGSRPVKAPDRQRAVAVRRLRRDGTREH